MKKWYAAIVICTGICFNAFSQDDTFSPYKSGQVAQNVTELWQDYDPRKEPLELKIIKEWKEDGVVTRYITFKVGTFKGADARIAAYYSFPDNSSKNPAFVWSHGGGQRAEKNRGIYFAKQGYVTVDINWNGRPMEAGIEENTDWGRIDPTQGPRFYSKALRKGWKNDLEPDEYSIDPVPSPRNVNYFLLSLAGRRAITFLEQQAEVDAERIGFTGYSMGGMVTALTAIDPRLRAVAPFVGGTGFRYVDFPGGQWGGYPQGKNELHINTVDAGSYWPLVKCPVIFISASNDFNAAFDRVYKSMALLTHNEWRVSTSMHENHRPGPEQWVLLNMWFDLYLKGLEVDIPKVPPSTFALSSNQATFTVTPEDQDDLLDTEIYYSYDPNPFTRFWKRADAVCAGKTWSANLKVNRNLPLYVFALCRYKLDKKVSLQNGETSTFVINSLEQVYMPDQVVLEELTKIGKTQTVFEDFEYGFRDWAVREGGLEISTYKFQSPDYDFSNDNKLLLRVDPGGRKLSLRLRAESRFLSHGENLGNFSYSTGIEGNGSQDVMIDRHEFKSTGGKELEWSKISRFFLSIVDETSKTRINLSSKEGADILRMITLADEESK